MSTKHRENIVPVEKWPSSFRYVYHNKGEYVNDHCIIRHKGIFHLFYISGRVGRGCYDLGNEIIIGHAVSSGSDICKWKKVKDALRHDPDLPHENRGIYAPYVIRHGNLFYLFYGSHNLEKAQFMNLAVSENLFEWKRHPFNPVFLPSTEWAFWDIKESCSCRDAHIIFEEKYGFIMYYVGDMKKDRELSCIAAATSNNLFNWQDRGQVLVRRHAYYEGIVNKTESPCVIRYENRYYLFYRHGNGTKFSVSDNPLNWEGRDSYFLASSHASEILHFGGKWYITSCSRPVADIFHAQDRSKGLYIGKLVWREGWPYAI